MLYGNVHDIRNHQYVTHGDDHPLNALISGNTIYEISKRKQPGDYLLIFGGFWNKKIADAHGDMIVVEPAIGYPSSFSNFKVYPSYAYLHSFVQDANLPINHYHVVIPHYFDVDDFDPHQPKEDYFLFVGRLNFDKGITLAIDLTAKIGARLKVCGQGNFQALGYAQIPDHVDFIGYVGVEKRKELMAKAKCVIMPTIYMEPFGCVVIESLLSGTPILTHDWGGPGENNIHGVTGFKCRTFEQFEWAARNIHLIEPKKCREWAEKNFSFDKIGHMYEDYFQSLQGGVDWYRPNPSRTNLDHLKKEYPVSSKWCVVIFAYGDIFYAPDSKRVLEDYFRFHGIPYYFITEKPLSFDTKEAHPSWWKLKVHSIVRGYDFIITWDLDLLPRNRHAKVIQEFDMTKICMVRDSSVSDTEDGFFKYNGGLIGIPKTYQSFMENIFDTHAPGVLADYEQYYLNNELFQNNMKIHELPRKLNGLYSTRYFPDALLQHYTHGHGAKHKIFEHRQMYFQEDEYTRQSIFRIIDIIPYVDENDIIVNHNEIERNEQIIASKYIPSRSTVLELGARYGTVSCVINSILSDPTKHVAVDPDISILKALEKNKSTHGAQFHIFNGVVSRKKLFLQLESYSTHTTSQDTGISVSSMSIEELETMYGLTFDCLVADCEGFMEQFIRENEEFVQRLETVTYEEDQASRCDYAYVTERLISFGFSCIHTEMNGSLQYRVWKKQY
jgi:FkbM family methyltransferase